LDYINALADGRKLYEPDRRVVSEYVLPKNPGRVCGGRWRRQEFSDSPKGSGRGPAFVAATPRDEKLDLKQAETHGGDVALAAHQFDRFLPYILRADSF
jgi:hypothetical protein